MKFFAIIFLATVSYIDNPNKTENLFSYQLQFPSYDECVIFYNDYEAKLLNEDIKAGIESLEVGLFGWDEIPWDQLAFESVRWALRNFKERQNSNTFVVFNNPN